jgi:hypothetical protein
MLSGGEAGEVRDRSLRTVIRCGESSTEAVADLVWQLVAALSGLAISSRCVSQSTEIRCPDRATVPD